MKKIEKHSIGNVMNLFLMVKSTLKRFENHSIGNVINLFIKRFGFFKPSSGLFWWRKKNCCLYKFKCYYFGVIYPDWKKYPDWNFNSFLILKFTIIMKQIKKNKVMISLRIDCNVLYWVTYIIKWWYIHA